jgi:hypothetical protein
MHHLAGNFHPEEGDQLASHIFDDECDIERPSKDVKR